jgi:hypothetical protein
MNKLWTFGDSMTEPFQNNNADWSLEYCNYKGYCPKVYGEILAEKLEMNLVNRGKGGIDNYTILEKICEDINKIGKDDIVIIGWTYPVRFRIVNDGNVWSYILPNSKKDKYIKSISQSTTDEILVNRNHNLYIKEIDNWIRLINKPLNNVIHWSYAVKLDGSSYLPNFNRIVTETSGACNDTHYSETGHIELSNTLYELLIHNKIKKII